MGGYGVLVDEDMNGEGPVERIPSVLGLTDSYIDSLEGKRLARRGAAV